MKAKEYYQKYGEEIWEESFTSSFENGTKMYCEMFTEINEICEQRNVKLDRGLMGVVREMNQKWNAVCNMFIKEHGSSPLKRNGFLEQIKITLGIKDDG